MPVHASDISWGDPLNYCAVEGAELSGEALLVVTSVVGVVHDPAEAEVWTSGPSSARCPGRALADPQPLDADPDGATEVCLVFDCPRELAHASEVYFTYSAGYTRVSIVDMLLPADGLTSPKPNGAQRLQWEGSPCSLDGTSSSERATPLVEIIDSELCSPIVPRSEASTDAGCTDPIDSVKLNPPHWASPSEAPQIEQTPSECFLPPCTPLAPNVAAKVPDAELSLSAGTSATEGGLARSVSPCDRGRVRQSLPQREVPQAVTRNVKREDGFRRSKTPPRGVLVPAPGRPPTRTSADTLCTAIETGHSRVQAALARRLRDTQQLQPAWPAGDASQVTMHLGTCRDDALAYGVMYSLQHHRRPVPAAALAQFLPLAQHLAQSECEEHAVAAMRCVLQVLRVSWPPVAKALRTVSTAKVLHEACEAVLASLWALQAAVKAMARSVRVSRTSGPLLPVCRKLKASLDEALADHAGSASAALVGVPARDKRVPRQHVR